MAGQPIEVFARLVRQSRRCGVVTVDHRARGAASDALSAVDEYVRSVGFQAIGEQWIEIDRIRAQETLSRLLSCDLAYGNEQMPIERASAIASKYLDLFNRQARFFTNRDESASTWMPISRATFDGGVIGLDDRGIGILWVEDED